MADETGLPAVAVILEQLPDGCTAHVVAEVADETEHQEAPRPARHLGDLVAPRRRRPGDHVAAGGRGRRLAAVRPGDLRVGRRRGRSMTAVRRHVRDVRGLDRASVSLVAYWRHRSTSDADAPDD